MNAADANGWVPLTYAAQNGHAAVVELLLRQPECDAGVADGDGCVRGRKPARLPACLLSRASRSAPALLQGGAR